MDLKVSGKTVLVTGSTQGIGRAIAARMAAEGATVIVNGRSADRVGEALKEIERTAARPGLAIGLVADLSDAAETAKAIQRHPDVDILVNNLGVYEAVPFLEITDEKWLRIFEVNVLSGVRLARHYLPRMLKKNSGSVVFVSSESALCTPAEMIHYGMTKTAQLAVSRGLAQLCAGTSVTVNSVLPGPTWSEGVERFVTEVAAQRGVSAKVVEEEFFKTVRPNSLIKRFATVEEVADTVAFVCSPLAAAISGAAVRCEGGAVPTIA